MNGETPLEMTHLPGRLRQEFTGKLPEATSGTPEQREKNFLSRALAAFTIRRLSGCTLEEAAIAVVDGGGDGGVDAIHYSPTSHRLLVVQAKFIESGRGEPELGEVSKFKNGLEALLQGQFAAFEKNQAWSRQIPQLTQHFNDPSLQVRAVLVYSGIHLVSDDRLRLFEDLTQRFSPDTDYFGFQPYNLTSIHDWLTGADEGPGVSEVELTLRQPGWIRQPYETLYGLVSLADLAALQAKHGKRLIAANIREYKGSTEVNDRILSTIRDEPHHFFYLNNGMTAYCESLEVNNLDRANAQQKRVTAFGFSIVNGAQTLGTISKFFAQTPQSFSEGFVFLKIISLERCDDELTFAQRITQSTNFQNQIGLRDFVALDEQQERIRTQLQLSDIHYHYKEGEDTPSPDDSNFTLDEATTALACLEQIADCDLCVRVLSNRKSLWSLEEVYPATEEFRSRYARLFRPNRSARTVWRAVQTRRAVLERMQANARSSAGIRKAFFENARWLVLNIVFLQLHPQRGESLALSAEELTAIGVKTLEIAEALWEVSEVQGYVTRRTAGPEPYQQTRHFRSVFCDAADCQRLRNATLAKLAQMHSTSQPSTGNV